MSRAEGRHAAEDPAVHRAVSHNQELPSPDCEQLLLQCDTLPM